MAPWPRAGGCSLWPGLGAGGHSPAETQLRTPATGAHIATGLRLLASLLSAAAPGPWDGKNGCPAVQQQPPPTPRCSHCGHGNCINQPSPAQPSQPSPAQTGRCRLELDNGGGAAAHRADTRDPINSIWSIVPDCKIFHWSGDINIWVSTLGICQE